VVAFLAGSKSLFVVLNQSGNVLVVLNQSGNGNVLVVLNQSGNVLVVCLFVVRFFWGCSIYVLFTTLSIEVRSKVNCLSMVAGSTCLH